MASEMEARLERLRLQVRPQDVEADPLRVQQATAAWQQHVEPQKEDEAPLHQPLFSTITFSDRQLLSDPRCVQGARSKRERHVLPVDKLLPSVPQAQGRGGPPERGAGGNSVRALRSVQTPTAATAPQRHSPRFASATLELLRKSCAASHLSCFSSRSRGRGPWLLFRRAKNRHYK